MSCISRASDRMVDSVCNYMNRSKTIFFSDFRIQNYKKQLSCAIDGGILCAQEMYFYLVSYLIITNKLKLKFMNQEIDRIFIIFLHFFCMVFGCFELLPYLQIFQFQLYKRLVIIFISELQSLVEYLYTKTEGKRITGNEN